MARISPPTAKQSGRIDAVGHAGTEAGLHFPAWGPLDRESPAMKLPPQVMAVELFMLAALVGKGAFARVQDRPQDPFPRSLFVSDGSEGAFGFACRMQSGQHDQASQALQAGPGSLISG